MRVPRDFTTRDEVSAVYAKRTANRRDKPEPVHAAPSGHAFPERVGGILSAHARTLKPRCGEIIARAARAREPGARTGAAPAER